eukprot:15672-Amorphochlora_amoeboformis.AAC.1
MNKSIRLGLPSDGLGLELSWVVTHALQRSLRLEAEAWARAMTLAVGSTMVVVRKWPRSALASHRAEAKGDAKEAKDDAKEAKDAKEVTFDEKQ